MTEDGKPWDYNRRMSFRIRSLHWYIAFPLFGLNMLGLMLTVRRSGMLTLQTVLLMVACSLVMSFITSFILVGLFDTIFRARSK